MTLAAKEQRRVEFRRNKAPMHGPLVKLDSAAGAQTRDSLGKFMRPRRVGTLGRGGNDDGATTSNVDDGARCIPAEYEAEVCR